MKEKSREQALMDWEKSLPNINVLQNAFVKFDKYGNVIYINMINYQAWYKYDDNGNIIYNKIINFLGVSEIHHLYDENNNCIMSY